jgi:hypothetical protein
MSSSARANPVSATTARQNPIHPNFRNMAFPFRKTIVMTTDEQGRYRLGGPLYIVATKYNELFG